jgi:UDP-2-acetamido-3-amino-2,3-dideoxy-glucuronate N-acetyltransferase
VGVFSTSEGYGLRMAIHIAQSALVSAAATISDGVTIWDFSQIRENSHIGANSIIGSYVYLDTNVQIGKNCKVQSRALIYEPANIGEGVFIGPGVILTNDHFPRAVRTDMTLKGKGDWEISAVQIEEGASIGAGAICVAPVRIGKWAVIGAGSVVLKNVKDFAIVVGNPARQIGWASPTGHRLIQVGEDLFRCSTSGRKFRILSGDLAEEFRA